MILERFLKVIKYSFYIYIYKGLLKYLHNENITDIINQLIKLINKHYSIYFVNVRCKGFHKLLYKSLAQLYINHVKKGGPSENPFIKEGYKKIA